MSCLCYCDEDDCRNTEEDCKLYDLSYFLSESLAKFLRNDGHICEDCLNEWKVDYPDAILKDKVGNIYLNPEFKESK